MYRLINLHTRGCVGSQIRLAGCVFIGKYVAQLNLLVWGWVGWMVRSKSGFGLPGDFSEMRLPCLWKEFMKNCSYFGSRCWLWMGLRRVIWLSIVPYSCPLFSMCCALDLSDMFVVAGLQITTRVAYIQVVARVALKLVNARSIVWWGFCM